MSSSHHQQSRLHLSSSASTSSVTTTTTEAPLPRLTADHLQQLRDQNYVVIPNFLPAGLQEELRADVQTLRSASSNSNYFNVARIGQDSTNQLNTDIRVAETCFLGPNKLKEVPSAARDQLYRVLDQVRVDLQTSTTTSLDASLTELLYAFYPQGGFYRRHRDAVPGSASTLRRYSLLLYLNDPGWNVDRDGGALRLHLDGGGDECPLGIEANYVDVAPAGGTLVLMASDAVPHEVLDTQRERVAVVGWYNRPVAIADAAELVAGDVSPVRLALLAVAAGLVTVGVLGLVQ